MGRLQPDSHPRLPCIPMGCLHCSHQPDGQLNITKDPECVPRIPHMSRHLLMPLRRRPALRGALCFPMHATYCN
eukprot:1156056-Pelagomonas_calceolata.AAC.14